MSAHRSIHCYNNTRRARAAGRVSPALLCLSVLLAIAAVGVGYLVIDRAGDASDSEGSKKARPSADAIAAELGDLQKEFQTLLQENLDLTRFEAKVRAFTQDYPEETDGYVLLAQIRTRLQKWEPAYAALSKALEDDPDGPELNKMAGACAAKLGELDRAEEHYQNAIRSAGSSADSGVYNALGQIYLAMRNASSAEEAFNKGFAARQTGSEQNYKHASCAGLADVAALRGDFDEAHKQIDRAIRFGSADGAADVPAYRIQKARLYMDNDQDTEAVAMLGLTWDADPESRWRIESARLRARLYERADELEKAVNHIAVVCDFHQTDAERIDLRVADFVALLAAWQIKAEQIDAAQVSVHNLGMLAPNHPKLEPLREALR